MKKFCARAKDFYVNIAADRMEEADGIVRVYNGDKLVGVFDLGFIDAMWLSEK